MTEYYKLPSSETAPIKNHLYFTPDECNQDDKLLMPPPKHRNIEPSQTRFPNQSSFYQASCNESSSSSISSCHYSLSTATTSVFTTNTLSSKTLSSKLSRNKKRVNKKVNVRSSSSLASVLRDSYTTPLRKQRLKSVGTIVNTTPQLH